MRRLALTGMLQFTQSSRVLHRAPGFGEDAAGPIASHRSAADLLAEAERALRMARVLAAGGFPEEVPALLAKALEKVAAARLAERNELPVGASSATDADIRRLVEREVLPHGALAILDASQPSAGVPVGEDVNALVSMAEQVLAATGLEAAVESSRRAA